MRSYHLLLGALLLLVSVSALQAGKIYWSDRRAGKVERANLDGTAAETLVTIASTNLRGLSIDVAGGKLYFADNQSNKIFRADIDGGEPEELVSELGFPADVKLDLVNHKIYWCDQQMSHIRRSALDGSNVELVLEAPSPYYLDLDLANNRLFWGGFSNGTVNRAQLDGADIANVVSNLQLTRGVKLDLVKGYLYWCDRQANVVQRRKIDGPPTALPDPAVETIVENLDTPHGLVLDPIARKAYWFDTGTDGQGINGSAVSRADMDLPGSPIEKIADLSQPWDGDLDLGTRSYAEWDARYFLIDRPESDLEPEDDFDQDGLNHVLEYGLTGHPERRDESPLYRVVHRTKDQGVSGPALQFQRFADSADLSYQLEVSEDLVTWTTSAGVAEVEPLDYGVERVTIASDSARATHMRLRITLKL